MGTDRWGTKPIDLEYLRRQRWWKDVDVQGPTECWPWLKSTASHGYGQTWDGVTVRLAHRVAWSLHNQAQIPVGMTIDHECRNRTCCNPAHLRPMTNGDNAAMNGHGLKTHCPAGHPYHGKNLYVDPHGHRRCRRCATTARRRRSDLS